MGVFQSHGRYGDQAFDPERYVPWFLWLLIGLSALEALVWLVLFFTLPLLGLVQLPRLRGVGCHGFHGEDAFAWSVVSLGLYFWLNDLTGWTGKPSLRGCNAVGWPYGR